MKYSLLVKVEPDGAVKRLDGRAAWMMEKLIKAGAAGITSLELPTGVRVAHAVYLLRRDGFVISTKRESHGGPFSGVHGRYKLESPTSIIEPAERAA